MPHSFGCLLQAFNPDLHKAQREWCTCSICGLIRLADMDPCSAFSVWWETKPRANSLPSLFAVTSCTGGHTAASQIFGATLLTG